MQKTRRREHTRLTVVTRARAREKTGASGTKAEETMSGSAFATKTVDKTVQS